jgi:hypothetical protein
MFCKKITLLLFFILCICYSQNGLAQVVSVIDRKGTITKVKNNKVTTATTAPSTPVEGDIWFDNINLSQILTKIWDGSSWIINEHKGTTGSVFFAGTNSFPTENNSQFFWDNVNNRLYLGGILAGTNKLNVNGTTRTSGLNNSDGTVSQPAYRFTSDSSTGIYLPSINQLGIVTKGIEAIRIDANQKVGIGLAIPLESLHIANNMRLNGSFGDKDGDKGITGQILSSTATGTDWIDGKLAIVKPLLISYTLVAADNGSVITINNIAATTLTIPSGLPIGFNVSVYQIGTGNITFVGSGTTIKNRLNRFRTAGIDAGIGIVSSASNIFHITGDLKK